MALDMVDVYVKNPEDATWIKRRRLSHVSHTIGTTTAQEVESITPQDVSQNKRVVFVPSHLRKQWKAQQKEDEEEEEEEEYEKDEKEVAYLDEQKDSEEHEAPAIRDSFGNSRSSSSGVFTPSHVHNVHKWWGFEQKAEEEEENEEERRMNEQKDSEEHEPPAIWDSFANSRSSSSRVFIPSHVQNLQRWGDEHKEEQENEEEARIDKHKDSEEVEARVAWDSFSNHTGSTYPDALEKHKILNDLPDDHAGMVQRIKSGQVISEKFNYAWWKYTRHHGYGKRDPASHSKEFLERFLKGFGTVEEGTNDEGCGSWASWHNWDARKSFRRRPAGDPDTWYRKIFVGNLPDKCTEKELKDYFTDKVGEVQDALVMVDRWNNSRGFGYIAFYDPDYVEIATWEHHVLAGRQLNVDGCQPHREPGSFRGNPAADAHAPGAQDKKIFVGNLPSWCTRETLTDFFNKLAPVEDAVVMMDRHTDQSRGFGYVFFKDVDGLEAALCENGRLKIGGQILNTDRCTGHSKTSKKKRGDPNMKLFVTGLRLSCTTQELFDAFRFYGAVADADITQDRQTGRSKGFGFVTFVNPDSLERALEDNSHLKKTLGKTMRVKRYGAFDNA